MTTVAVFLVVAGALVALAALAVEAVLLVVTVVKARRGETAVPEWRAWAKWAAVWVQVFAPLVVAGGFGWLGEWLWAAVAVLCAALAWAADLVVGRAIKRAMATLPAADVGDPQ